MGFQRQDDLLSFAADVFHSLKVGNPSVSSTGDDEMPPIGKVWSEGKKTKLKGC